MKAPFPWFGGKSIIAPDVWRRFGNAKCYIEPFFGSGAMLLNRPEPFDGVETINDKDGLVSNFWRAVKAEPDAVAEHADWPVLENDLVDQWNLMLFPTILGKGKRLFGEGFPRRKLKLVEDRGVGSDGVLVQIYERA